jgi:hypothetical protein
MEGRRKENRAAFKASGWRFPMCVKPDTIRESYRRSTPSIKLGV